MAGEIARQLTWSDASAEPFHFRDRDGAEVDLVLETPDGRVAAVETKSALSVSARDFRHMEGLRRKLGTEFVNGVVLYSGPHVLAFGDRMTAMPVSALWAG